MARLRSRLIVAGIALQFVVLHGCAAAADPDIPPSELEVSIERLRPQLTDEERDDFIETCLIEQGSIAFSRNPRGGFDGTNVRDSDVEAMETCVELSFERWPNPPPPETRSDFAVLYELYIKETECLNGLGMNVTPPTLDTYIDEGGRWTPYVDLPVGPAELAELEVTCPQNPWHYVD